VSWAEGLEVKTLLLTDIESSTAHWEHDPEVMAATVGRHDDIVRGAVEACGGRFVRHRGEGDSTFSVFDDAAAALDAAVSLQRALIAERWVTTEPLRVRVGIHTGEVEIRDGDYHGRAINRTARVRGLAEGSTILATAAAVDAAGDVPQDAVLVDLGEHPLRGLAGLEHLYAIGHPDLPDPAAVLDYLGRRSAAPLPPTLRLHDETPLIGRDRELASLCGEWDVAARGRASLALVSGEPGIGKTRFAAALAAHAAEGGAQVLYGRCDEDALRPYQPVAEALSGAVDRLSGSELAGLVGDDAADLSLVLPELRARIPVWGQPTLERFVLFQAAARLVGRLAASRPMLVVLDDLQWADEPSLTLLRHALRDQAEAALMVVATYRDGDVGENPALLKWLVQLRREVPTQDVTLRGLSVDDVSELLGTMHRHRVDEVWSVTDGNPFFVIELRRGLDDDAPGGMPLSVRESVRDRVERLSPVARRFVSAAAVVGVDVDVRVAATAADVSVDDAMAAPVPGVLAEVPDAPDAFRFTHGLVRSAVVEGLTANTRAWLHGRVAAAVEDVHADEIDRYASALAFHHRESGDRRADGPAYVWSMRAGRQAGQLLAYEEAEMQYRAAAQMAADGGDAVRRITAELELSEILTRSGRPNTGHELASGAAAEASAIGATDLAAWAIFNTRFAQALGLPGNLEAVRDARAALAPDSPWLGPVDVVYAGELMQAGEVERGIELLRDVAARARDAGDHAMLGFALTGSHTYVDRLEVGVDEIMRAIDRADDASAPSFRLSPEVLRVQSDGFRVGELVAAGDINGARRAAAEFTARYGDETGIVEANVPLFLLTDAMLSGDWEDHRRQLARLRESPELSSGYAAQLGGCEMIAAWCRGRLGEMGELLEAMPPSMMLVRPGLALSLAEAGRPEDARRVIDAFAADGRLVACSRTVFGRSELVLLGLAAGSIRHTDVAGQIYELLAPRQGQVAAWAAWAIWGAFDHVLGVLAAAGGRAQAAVDHLKAALRLHDAAGWRTLSANTAAELAIVLVDRGRPGDLGTAARLLADTEPIASELQLAGVERRLARVAERLAAAG
jgi:class 3 adenylate cyclase